VIVPLVDGAGLKGKLAEALSYGVPTVTTTIGAEGFKLSKNGEHPFVISDDPVDYAHQLFRIASDRNLAAKYSNDSFEYVVQHLSENAMDTTLNAIIGNKSLRS
jgi:glycosyltransferase involved in cell wall biosynthesis